MNNQMRTSIIASTPDQIRYRSILKANEKLRLSEIDYDENLIDNGDGMMEAVNKVGDFEYQSSLKDCSV